MLWHSLTGIGFKSVFLVSSQPHVISNGFRIRLNENKDKEADVGFIVPEWVDDPSDELLSQLFGVGLELPTTAILLPLKADKITAVQQQIAQMSPEILLFLAQIKELTIRDDQSGTIPRVIKVHRRPWPVMPPEKRLSTVELSVDGLQQESASYFCCTQEVPVNLPKDYYIEQRSGVKNWVITLAFPMEGRISGGTSGNVYSFLPTEHQSGLPCLLNADFLLTSSRESIHFDSPWNQGIFEQVPKVFVSAFSIMVSSSRDGLMCEFLPIEAQTVYKFVPIKASPNRHFNKLRESAISALASSNVVLCYSKSISEKPPLLFPHQCRRLFKRFCEILKHAASTSQRGVSHFMTADLFIVDTEVQCKFGAQLEALGVVQFHPNEYFPLLGPWISKLQEEVYVEFLHFLASEMGSASSDKLRARPLLKYVETSGSVGLACLSQTETLKIKLPSTKECPWLPWLYAWIGVFFNWVPIHFLPRETVQEIWRMPALRRQEILCWLHTSAKVSELCVKDYSHDLMNHNPKDPRYCILVAQYLFNVQEQFFNDPLLVSLSSFLANKLPIVDIKRATVPQPNNGWHSKKQVMLPGCRSDWPLLLPGNSWEAHLIKMHDDYVIPQSPLANLSAASLLRYMNFLRGKFRAKNLLDIDPPDCPLPQMQRSGNNTDLTVNLLLEWLQAILKRGGNGKLPANGEFMASVRSYPWLPTSGHGDKRPTDVFWPSEPALQVFQIPSVPFLAHRYCVGISNVELLALVGLVTDVNLGHRAVVSLLNDMINQPADRLQKEMILNIYKGVRKMQWDCVEVQAIWIPPFPRNNNVACWVLKKDCVAYDKDGLFQDFFPSVLSHTYDEDLVQFFVSKFHVQSEPTVEDYCSYWKRCMYEGRKLSYGDCKKVWGSIANLHRKCEGSVWEEFLTVGLVPAIEAGTRCQESCEVKPASQVYIPDKLEFVDKFGDMPTGLWVPLSQAAPEDLQDLYAVYRSLGAQLLSECTEVELTDLGKRSLATKRTRTTTGWICEGLFRAVLGFLHGQGRSQVRQKWLDVVSALVNTSEVELDSPVEIEYCLYSSKDVRDEVINRVSGHRMVYWDKDSNRLFSVDHKLSTSATARATVGFEFSHAIAEGILGLYSRDLVDDMRKFLFGLSHFNFDLEVIHHMLRADNIQLSPHEEGFISAKFSKSMQATCFGSRASFVDPVGSTHSTESNVPRCMDPPEMIDFFHCTTNGDICSQAGVSCAIPPLAMDYVRGESYAPVQSSSMPFKFNPQAPPFLIEGKQENSGFSSPTSVPAARVGLTVDVPVEESSEKHENQSSPEGSAASSSWGTTAISPCGHLCSHCKELGNRDFCHIECTLSRQFSLVHLEDDDKDRGMRQLEGMDIKSDVQAAVDNVEEHSEGANGQRSNFKVQSSLRIGFANHTKGRKSVRSPDLQPGAGCKIQEQVSNHSRGRKDFSSEHPLCGEDTGKVSSNGSVKPGKTGDGAVVMQGSSIRGGDLKARPTGQTNGVHLKCPPAASIRTHVPEHESENSSSSGSFSSLSKGKGESEPKRATLGNFSSLNRGKKEGTWTRPGSKQPNSLQIRSPPNGSDSSRDYEQERLQRFLESVYELSGAQSTGTDESSACSSLPTESQSRFRHGARRMVVDLPNLKVNRGEGDHANGCGGEPKLTSGHLQLQATPVRFQKPQHFSPLDETLIRRWVMYRAPKMEEAKMSTAVKLPAETYKSLDWWRKEHLPEVKKVLGYTMARHLTMKLGPMEEKCDIDSLFTLAFVHQRYPDAHGASYQRLEFLGDACLGLAVTTELFRHHPTLNEHYLTQLRSALVCNSTCALFFRSAHLDRHVITARGKVSPEDVTDSIAADVFEAVLAAGYLAHGKHGLSEVRRLVFDVFLPHLHESLSIVPEALGPQHECSQPAYPSCFHV